MRPIQPLGPYPPGLPGSADSLVPMEDVRGAADQPDGPYRERVWPSAWVWALCGALGTGLAIAYGAAYGAVIGLIVLVPAVSLPLWALILASPILTVSDHRLTAGRAAIPTSVVARCACLGREQMERALRLPDPSIFTLVRPWTVRSGVLLQIEDPLDPHSTWLLSTRHPHRLASALERDGVDIVDQPMR